MALSEERLLAIQIDYELGKLSKSQICKNHRISRPTLRKHAKAGNWIYQESFNKVSNEVRTRVTEKIIEKSSEEIIQATEIFLKNSSWLRDLVMESMERLKEKIDYDNLDLIAVGSIQKIIETSAKTITNLYTNDRKALGLDRDDDIEKARRIKHGEIDGSGSNKLQERIKEKMKANGFDD